MTKSETELAHMRKAAEITSAGMAAAIEATEAGVTENVLSGIAAKEMIDLGSEPFSIDPITSGSHRSGWFHTTFKRADIGMGDHVLLEFGGCWHRYTAPLMRTVILGEAERYGEEDHRCKPGHIGVGLLQYPCRTHGPRGGGGGQARS